MGHAMTQPNADDDPILIPKEAARDLRITEKSLYRWRLNGSGPEFCRIGRGRGRIGYRKSAIKRYLEERARQSTSQEVAA